MHLVWQEGRQVCVRQQLTCFLQSFSRLDWTSNCWKHVYPDLVSLHHFAAEIISFLESEMWSIQANHKHADRAHRATGTCGWRTLFLGSVPWLTVLAVVTPRTVPRVCAGVSKTYNRSTQVEGGGEWGGKEVGWIREEFGPRRHLRVPKKRRTGENGERSWRLKNNTQITGTQSHICQQEPVITTMVIF